MEVDGEIFELGAGDQALVPADASQRITATGTQDLRFYCLCTPRFLPVAYANLEKN
jgi:mannose-6-phosphate isomerase-like protein (cupin superfamily)